MKNTLSIFNNRIFSAKPHEQEIVSP